MNLQPVTPANSLLAVYCSKCYGRTSCDEAKADIDAQPGTYYCPDCAIAACRGDA